MRHFTLASLAATALTLGLLTATPVMAQVLAQATQPATKSDSKMAPAPKASESKMAPAPKAAAERMMAGAIVGVLMAASDGTPMPDDPLSRGLMFLENAMPLR